MAKTIRKIFTMILAICVCAGMIIPQALAAEITTETTTEGGITTTVTTTTETIVDGETSEVTVIVDTTKTGTDADDFTVDYSETETTTTTTEADGTVTETVVTDGSETKTWTGDVEVGDEGQPEVKVEIIPGETTNGSADNTVVEGDINSEEGQTTTTTNKEVTVETGDVNVEIVESEADIESIKPEDYEGKYYSNGEGLMTGIGENMLGDAANPSTKPEDDGYDFHLTGWAEATNACRAEATNITYLKDENGNPVLDENGNYIIESIDLGKYEDGFFSTPTIFALTTYDEEGKIETHYYGYCIDNDTEANAGAWYRISNLEDSDYYPDSDSSDKLRAVVTNGYWGQEDGMGSVAQIREKMLAYYGEDGTITVDDKNGNPVTFKVSDILDNMTEADALTMTQAAIWTYSNGSINTKDGKDGTIITGIYSVVKPKSNLANCDRDYDSQRDAILKAGYEWLISLPGMSAPDASTVINEKNYMKDSSIVVGDKVGEVVSTDENGNEVTNGVYETALNFTLAFVPGDNDDLLMHLKYKDMDGNEVVVIRRLAGQNSEGQDYAAITPAEDGSYTIDGLKLSENEDFTFDLRLEGTQVLDKGVYIYQSYVSEEHPESQTIVGIASGTQDVSVNASITLSFSVDESKEIVAEREWHSESDPVVTPPETPDTPPVVPTTPPEDILIPDEDVPQDVMTVDGDVILDEEVPLADVPSTGDASVMWLLLSAAVIIGLVLVNLSNKKRTEA